MDLKSPHRRIRLPPVVAKPPPAATAAGVAATGGAGAAAPGGDSAAAAAATAGTGGLSGSTGEGPLSAYQTHVTEALIVRTLKEKKSLSFKDLGKVVDGTLPFPVSVANLKIVVQALIARDFVERSANNVISYIA